MILIQAGDFDRFLATFGWLRNASVEVTSAGGNELLVPDNTDRALLRSIADTGAVVHADLGMPATTDEPDPEVDPEPEAEPEVGPESDPEPEVEPKAEAEPQSEAKPEPAADKAAPKKSTRARRKTTTEE